MTEKNTTQITQQGFTHAPHLQFLSNLAIIDIDYWNSYDMVIDKWERLKHDGFGNIGWRK